MRHISFRRVATCAVAALAFVASVFPAQAQDEVPEQSLFKLNVGTRFDWQLDRQSGHTNNDFTGFRVKYLLFRVDGSIIPGLDYSWRQRLSQELWNGNMFDATDWIYLRWQYKRFSISAGKEVLAIGGYEFDRYPLDIFAPSVCWWNVAPFQIGATVGLDVSKNDRISFQVTQSPFHRYDGMNPNTYSYNLHWAGHHGIWHSLWSANLLEYQPGRYLSMLVLGNRFVAGPVELELDAFNRAASGQTFLFKDVSVIADLAWNPSPAWKLHVKYSLDHNSSGTDKDLMVGDGTNLQAISGGVEYYPLRKDRWSLRLHATAGWYWGDNASPIDPMQHNTLYATVGVSWHMNLLDIKRK